uniref:Uncharacterized protein n=1 Tax=Rhizophora mucronata TaxID=61149 RepID=A0A2P2IKA8_RHIMU
MVDFVFQAIFQRYPRPEKEYQSFSLIYSDRSLDLVSLLSDPFVYACMYSRSTSLQRHGTCFNLALFVDRYVKTKMKQKSGLLVLRH